MRKIYGFTVGGALIKDKLFWIYTYDQHTHIFPMLAIAGEPSAFYTLPDRRCLRSTCNTTTGVLDRRSAERSSMTHRPAPWRRGRDMTSYAAGASLPTTPGIASLNSDLGTVSAHRLPGDQHPQARLADQPARTSVSFLYHRLRWDSPGGVQTSAPPALRARHLRQRLRQAGLRRHQADQPHHHQHQQRAALSVWPRAERRRQAAAHAYDTSNLVDNGNDPYVTLDTSVAGFTIGSPYYSYRPAFPDERKWQIGDILFYQHGNHSFKFGVDMVHNYDLTNQSQYYEGNFTYSSNIANYFADLYSKGSRSARTCNSTQATSLPPRPPRPSATIPATPASSRATVPTTFDIATLDQGYYAQDDWKFSPRLTCSWACATTTRACPTSSAP